MTGPNPPQTELEHERADFLAQLEDLLEPVVLVLGIVWLALLVVEFLWGLNPVLQAFVWIIWVIFIVDFAVRFLLAPRKLAYLRGNWLTAISLFIPALRVLRLARFARVLSTARSLRGIQLVRVVSSVNRGMRSLRRQMGRRGVGYVIALSILIAFAGSAAMFQFEKSAPGGGFASFGDAFYWTAMMLTTLGGGYTPETAEGRVLAVLLALYAFTVFGFITATLATFFIGQDSPADPQAGTLEAIQELQAQVAALRRELAERPPGPPAAGEP